MGDNIKLFFFAIMLPLGSLAAEPELKIASDEWCPFICINDQQISHGFLVDAAKEILEPANIKLSSLLLPLNRAMLLAEQGEIDGIYAPAISERLHSSVPLIHSKACFFVNKQTKWHYSGIKDLAGVSINVVDDYGYDGGSFDAFLSDAKRSKATNVIFRTGHTAAKTNVQLLSKKRITILLEHEAVMVRLLTGINSNHQIRKAGCLAQSLPLVIGISRSHPNGKKLIQLINNGINELRISPRWSQLIERYQLNN